MSWSVTDTVVVEPFDAVVGWVTAVGALLAIGAVVGAAEAGVPLPVAAGATCGAGCVAAELADAVIVVAAGEALCPIAAISVGLMLITAVAVVV
jgi:hypothetical protein